MNLRKVDASPIVIDLIFSEVGLHCIFLRPASGMCPLFHKLLITITVAYNGSARKVRRCRARRKGRITSRRSFEMLVLSRTRGQAVMIGDQIVVTVVDLRGDKVRLGISAPKDVSVHRQEIYEAIKGQNIASSTLHVTDLPKSAGHPQPIAIASVKRPELSPLLKPWKDPVSGIESFILSERGDNSGR